MQIVSRDADASKPSDDWTLPAEAALDENISPELWQSYSDAYTFNPSPEDEVWAAFELNKDATTGFDVAEAGGLDGEEQVAELHRWLDSLAPSDDELAARDLPGGAFLGHGE